MRLKQFFSTVLPLLVMIQPCKGNAPQQQESVPLFLTVQLDSSRPSLFQIVLVSEIDPEVSPETSSTQASPGFSVMIRQPLTRQGLTSQPLTKQPLTRQPLTKQPEVDSSPVQPAPISSTQKKPPEPPPGIRAAEPESSREAVQESLTLPINAPSEPPSRISLNRLEPKKEDISSTRTIWSLAGRPVEISFRGNGWIYLGEEENRTGITYNSRRVDSEGQQFIFQGETAGTYTLKFYKQDFIEDYIINEYVQVIISENPIAAGTNRTQPAAQSQVPAVRQPETVSSPVVQPSAAAANSLVPQESPAPVDYLQQAREAYTAGMFAQAISLLDQFREQHPAGTDEAWWLYAQSLEANSSSRDIRSALDYYRRLLQEYPQSLRSIEAQRRIAYLERYYFNIR